jgi:two-component system chemotaxis response regulator CheB
MAVKVLIIDDSKSMQRLLAAILSDDPMINVVGMASDPYEARTMIKELNPDVLTLDIEMPKMDGLQFLAKVMALRPMPVVMISSHTGRGTELSLEALSQGAFCCLPKPRIDDEAALREICAMVKSAAQSSASITRNAKQPGAAATATKRSRSGNMPEVIAIGSSTGGVEALTTLFTTFPADCPPTVVTQHMPASFTKSFAERLNKICKPTVSEASNLTALEPGHIYIAPGAVGHTKIIKTDKMRTRVSPGEPVEGHMPSVNVLFDSLAETGCKNICSAILTGMGSDGASGLLRLKQAGAKTIAQDERTSLVYGMPKAAHMLGAASHVLPITKIADALLSY